MMEDWANLCRSCLASGNQVPLFGKDEEIRQKFIETTSIEPKQDDGLPPNLCYECVLIMNSAHQFRKQCQKLDAELKQQLENIRQLTQKRLKENAGNKVNIKKEIYDEEDDDFYYVLVIDSEKQQQEQVAEKPIESVKMEPPDIDIVPIEIEPTLNFDSTNLLSSNGSADLLEAARLPGEKLPIDFMDMGDNMIDSNGEEMDPKHANIAIEPHIILTSDQDNITSGKLVELLGGDKNTFNDGTLILKDSNGEYIRCVASKEEDEVILCNGNDNFEILSCDDGSELVIEYADESQVATVIQQEDGTYVCSCGEVLKSLDNYDVHQSNHEHSDTLELFSASKLLQGAFKERPLCKFCNKRFANVANMRKHLMMHHPEEQVSFAKHKPNILSKNEDEMRTVGYACMECGKLFTSHASLEAHSMMHDGHKDTRASERDSHLCFECGAVLPSKRAAAIHMSTHYPNKNKGDRFACSMCGKKCPSNAMLLMHERVHTNERPFPCLQCSLRFKTKTHLRTHMLTHTQEKKFGCSVCMKFFALKGNLVVHLRTHTGERPYACSLCNEAFIDSKYLKNHKKKKHNIDNVPWNEFAAIKE